MNHGTSNPAVLPITVHGPTGCAQIILGANNGRQAAYPLQEITPTVSGPVAGIQLEGKFLGNLSEAERYQLLRHCRHLLRPGGQLSLPIGPDVGQFPHAGLNEAAWLAGFESWVEFVAGRAVLKKPRHPAPDAALVSIVIPAYKSTFFAAALASAQAQTWPHCEIVVCDDSLDGEIAELVAADAGLHPVRYIRNPGNIGGRANYLQGFDLARGHYLKFLNDDDLLAPDCVARMAAVLDEHPAVTLVTSHRRLIDAAGHPLPDEIWTRPLTPADGLMDGRQLAAHVMSLGMNLIGEPTTVMFRKSDMTDSRPHLMSFAGESARRNGDMSIWMSLLSRGDAVNLTDSLSSLRLHEAQVQKDPDFQVEAVLAWTELTAAARRTGLFDEAQDPELVAVDLAQSSDLAEGEGLFHAGNIAAAIAVFETALQRDPTDAQARGNLACACWEADLRRRALIEGVLASYSDPANETLALNLKDMLAVGV